MKLKPSIIALDLDDTLLRHDLSISDRTVATLRAAMDRGILVVLASGRSQDAMTDYSHRIGIDRENSYLVCNNGAQIITSNTGKIIHEEFLSQDIALEAFQMVKDAGLSCHIYEDNIIHVSKETKYSDRDKELSGLKPIVPENYEDLIRRGTYKLVIPGDPDYIVPVEAEFKVAFKGRATVFVSKPYFLELLPFNCGKGEALQYIAETVMGLTKDDVMAFGDSMNDESMIQYAGLSVAMSNGRKEILEQAAYHTYKSNDDDGIADFLEKHVL